MKVPPETAGPIYEAAEARRSASNQMMWQVPALSLAAQSFLLTVALEQGTSLTGRIVAAVVGAVAALATAQLMLKHRYHEIDQSRWLERFWAAQGWPRSNPHARGVPPSERPDHPLFEHDRWGLLRRATQVKSPTLWTWSFVGFALIDMATIGLSIAGIIH